MRGIIQSFKKVTVESPDYLRSRAIFREARKHFGRLKPICRKKNKYEERLTSRFVMQDCSCQNEEWAIKLRDAIKDINSGII